MQTITVEIINNKALKLLKDLELLQLIKLHKSKSESNSKPIDWVAKYKGAMNKQSITEINKQLNELRNEWE